jgi:competence protein ComEC
MQWRDPSRGTLSVAAVFGILLLRKPLQALVEHTLLRPFQRPPDLLSNLLAVSLAVQIATTPIVVASFEEVSVIGVLTNLAAVPISGPILTMGLLGTLAGNMVAPFADLANVSNGFLVTFLVWVAEAASALPIAAVATPGAMLPLVGLFYLGCVPAALAEATLLEERWPRVAGLLVVWAALWILLVAVL